MTDLAITFDGDINQLHFAISLTDGDFTTTDGLEPAVLYSLFTDAKASDDDELPDGGTDLRGHWADNLLDESEGSKLWLLRRRKQTQETLNLAVQYAKEALQWLIDDEHATKVDVTGEWVKTGWLALTPVIWMDDVVLYSKTIGVP